MPFDLPLKVMPVPAASLKFTTNEEIDEVRLDLASHRLQAIDLTFGVVRT